MVDVVVRKSYVRRWDRGSKARNEKGGKDDKGERKSETDSTSGTEAATTRPVVNRHRTCALKDPEVEMYNLRE